MSQLNVHSERCVHQRVLSASCRSCVEACPTAAWSINENGLGFDQDACDACGLCVAVCPMEALELPAPVPRVAVGERGERTMYMACARSGVPAGTGVTPCLYGLSPEWLLRSAAQLKVDHVAVAPGDCDHCPRGQAGLEWRTQWIASSNSLRSSQGAAPHLRPVPSKSWPSSSASPAPAIQESKRKLFGIRSSSRERGVDDERLPAVTSERMWLAALSDKASEQGRKTIPVWSVSLTADRCTWCLACVRLCPTEALLLNSDADDPSAVQFEINKDRCTGCGLCSDVCAEDAITKPLLYGDQPGSEATRQSVPLKRLRCPACQVEFYQRQINDITTSAPQICPTCRQGRWRQHNRLVQSEPGL